MKERELLRVPPLTTRSSLGWLIATGVGGLAVFIVSFATQPENRVFVVVIGPLLALYFVAITWTSTWLDPADGAILLVRYRRFRRRVPLGPGTQVDLVSNRGGGILLRISPPGRRRRAYVSLLLLTMYVERSQDPDLLRLLADTLERHGTDGGPAVAQQLRAQAEHIDAGGHPRTSPLAALVTYLRMLPLRPANISTDPGTTPPHPGH